MMGLYTIKNQPPPGFSLQLGGGLSHPYGKVVTAVFEFRKLVVQWFGCGNHDICTVTVNCVAEQNNAKKS